MKNTKPPLRKSTRISIGIIISVIIGDIFFTWLYYYSGVSEFWILFLMNQVLFTIAITNYLALILVPYTYRTNEPYLKHTKKVISIMAKASNELEKRGINDETIADKIVKLFNFVDQNEKEIEAFGKCVIDPIKDRIADMPEQDRIMMYHNIGVGVNYYLDDLESISSLSDDEIVNLLERKQRKSLRGKKDKV